MKIDTLKIICLECDNPVKMPSNCRNCRNVQGFVSCDNEKCYAKDNPSITKSHEIWDAYIHWRFHSNMKGCSHGH